MALEPAARPALVRRITFINRFFAPDLSPTSELLTQLAAHFAAEGWSVAALASQRFYDRPGRLPARALVGEVHVRRLPVTGLARLGLVGRAVDYLSFYLGAFLSLIARLRRGDIVVVNTDPPLIGVIVHWAARLRGARTVNWLHDLYPEVAEAHGLAFAAGPVGRFLARRRDACLRAAALNVAICESMAALIDRRAPGARVRVVHNWCDDRAIRPLAAEANPLRAAWGLEGRFVVGYSGNLGRAHDWRTMALAAQRLAERADVTFLMIGAGAGMAALKAEIERLGLRRRFQFRAYQPRESLAQTLGLADVHLVSQLPAFEGLLFPSKLYGAAAAGRGIIVIGDPDGELAKLVRSHACGEAVNSADVLAGVIERCAEDRSIAADWGRKARLMLEAAFTREQAFASWTAAIAQLM